jgi:hypothetical protein
VASTSVFQQVFEKEFKWPASGDTAFKPPGRWIDGAEIERNEFARLVFMTRGYKLAGDLMVARAKEDRYDRKDLIYPILFNYRHFVELSLKYLISTYGSVVAIEPIWDTHRLEKLWFRFSEIMIAYRDPAENDARNAVGAVIAEFAKVDPDSFSYRYPVTRKGEPIAPLEEALEIANLADAIEKLDNYFTGCGGWLENLKSASPDFGSEW